jgi:hypothetical protein
MRIGMGQKKNAGTFRLKKHISRQKCIAAGAGQTGSTMLIERTNSTAIKNT